MSKTRPFSLSEAPPLPGGSQPVGGENRSSATGPTVVSLARSASSPSGSNEALLGVSAISLFVDLEIEARQCSDLNALRFAIVNSSGRLAQFDLAVLAEPTVSGAWSVTLASNVSSVDRQAPVVATISRWLNHPRHAADIARGEARQVDIQSEMKQLDIGSDTFSFPNGFWLPIRLRSGRPVAALLALRKDNWRPQQTALLLPLVGAYGHAWEALLPRSRSTLNRLRAAVISRRVGWALAAVALLAMLVPVPLSALAPAEVVAREPVLVTAPIDGVIGEILALPGAWVAQGATIARFVDVKLRNDAEVARRSRAVAEARYFKTVQTAVSAQKDAQELALVKAEVEVAKAEVDYAEELLKRSEIRAEKAGLLIYSAKSDWIGKPISVGEKIMEIGDPARSEIMVELPISDAIALRPGGKVSLFLDGDPLQSIPGEVTQTSYRPTLTADQQLAFKLYAKFSDGTARRIGLRGVARISGEPVSLGFYLFRRPLAALRQRIGL
jgi:hypothetical protein